MCAEDSLAPLFNPNLLPHKNAISGHFLPTREKDSSSMTQQLKRSVAQLSSSIFFFSPLRSFVARGQRKDEDEDG